MEKSLQSFLLTGCPWCLCGAHGGSCDSSVKSSTTSSFLTEEEKAHDLGAWEEWACQFPFSAHLHSVPSEPAVLTHDVLGTEAGHVWLRVICSSQPTRCSRKC